MEWNTEIKCPHCKVKYVVHHHEDTFPYTCPFCGGNVKSKNVEMKIKSPE